jgi:glutamate---cysteine ligase / carboxylate-amine ligase
VASVSACARTKPADGPARRRPAGASLEEVVAAFRPDRRPTVGVEEEVMLLEPETLDLVPRAGEVLDRARGDSRLKLEMPASQLENVTPPRATVALAVGDLAAGRRRLLDAAGDVVRFAAAGAHPFAAPEGDLNPGERNREMLERYGVVARRQLVCALQVHVAAGGPERSLAVYNSLRGYLPEIAALAAAAPFYEGRDSGLASVRPTIAQMLPRQGVPPALPSWEAFAAALRWGSAARTVPTPRRWWWELRPNVVFGTLEVRVADAQPTVGEAGAVAAFVHALVGWLVERHEEGERLAVPETWRVAENRWSACRDGVEGTLADLATGRRVPTRERLRSLLAEVAPVGARLGCSAELEDAARLVEENGAIRQRRVGEREGALGIARWLTERFADLDTHRHGPSGLESPTASM